MSMIFSSWNDDELWKEHEGSSMIAAKKLGGPYSLPTPYGTTTDKTNYFPQVNKKRLRELLDNVSEDEARAIIHRLFQDATDPDRKLELSDSIVNGLTMMATDDSVPETTPTIPTVAAKKGPSSGMHVMTNIALGDGAGIVFNENGQQFRLTIANGQLVMEKL